MSSERIRVAVLFGGRSGEHPVSCISAAGVLAHLDPAVFDVSAIGITPQGAWVRVEPAEAIAAASTPLPEITAGAAVVLSPDPTSSVITPAVDGAGGGGALSGSVPSGSVLSAALDVDVVFPVLHGPWGEDGTVQGLLELAGVPYVGNGVLASAAGMDKEFTKKLLAAEGLAVGDYVVLRRGQDTVVDADRSRLGLPVFVKPARAGSSLGVSRVDRWSDLDAAIAVARAIDPKVLVEAARIGREIECGVLEFPDGRVEASPTAEIGMPAGQEFYDFQAKYVDDVATFSIPADLPDGVTRQIQEMALRAFSALDAQGLARVDFFVTEGDQVVINEVNTLPGFTPISMFPRMWAAAGVGYAELVDLLIRTALARGTGLR